MHGNTPRTECVLGTAGEAVSASALVLGALILAFAGLAWRLFAVGYKIKA